MSSIIEFFIAPGDDAAAAVAGHGPDGVTEVARYGNFDPVTTTGEWESCFGIAGNDGPRIIAGDGRPLVLAVSASLQAALAAADEEQLAEAATRWAELPAGDGEEIHPEFARDMLSQIASLARTATHRGHRLYYWWG
jgi:hypothetical protein